MDNNNFDGKDLNTPESGNPKPEENTQNDIELSSEDFEEILNITDEEKPEQNKPEQAPPEPPQPDYSQARHERVYVGNQSPYQGNPNVRGNFYQSQPIYEQPEPNKTKKEKKKKGLSGGAIALIIAACVILSGGAAFGATCIARSLTTVNTDTEADTKPSVKQSSKKGGESIIYKSTADRSLETGTYSDVAKAVLPSVVEIQTESVSTASFFGGNYITSGAGSGVIVSENGKIITNNHIVEGASTVTVITNTGDKYPAEVLGTDAEADIAVISIEAEGLTPAVIGKSADLKVAEEVLAVGNPLGNLGGSVTMGIVSALSREVSLEGYTMNLIQTDAAINPGNSGGGLFNMHGELIGIVNAKTLTTSSGTAVEGIGYAIPVDNAVDVADALMSYGYVKGRAGLGITYIDIEDSYKAMYYRVDSLGMYVVESKNTDLKPGDRITAINGEEVTYSEDLKKALRDTGIGEKVKITVVRDGKYVDVELTTIELVPTETEEEQEPETLEESAQGGSFNPFFDLFW